MIFFKRMLPVNDFQFIYLLNSSSSFAVSSDQSPNVSRFLNSDLISAYDKSISVDIVVKFSSIPPKIKNINIQFFKSINTLTFIFTIFEMFNMCHKSIV
jgi:hypothetical protein